DFALGAENQLIANEVRQGKVKIVYKALETASQTANNSMFVPSQTAAPGNVISISTTALAKT
ncbi:MAG TPA: hypothetical protein VMF14_18485, partial [Solirubrobacteraceae bacterium]|nr:hypothetical protein [Solirubrobacteraceae bacterium]